MNATSRKVANTIRKSPEILRVRGSLMIFLSAPGPDFFLVVALVLRAVRLGSFFLKRAMDAKDMPLG